ncbi:ThiJ/PfpI family protein [Punctularia strigosozonata HHB-11173 SS5]|uniref:ThiJ/PfpI family protein n=1 Tax=Punctularia strigosozonata (strain HHB-11173) TaxID=741275 RepID=UPI0004416527|nr:ThiJ/PfpI family protein [Punctularia strigosozonata HHB-11173 SS5]EIN14256.1 ThiJ/PfpI family protein [Punctularia strigosozonata HHB-11173 SS5]
MTYKVLIVLSDAHAFPVKKKDGTVVEEETGFFLHELAAPLTKLLDYGIQVTFASPEGRQPQPDPLSVSPLAFLGAWWVRNRENELIKKMELENNLLHPRPFKTITADELESFDGVFIPGGHAPLSDLGQDPELGRILLHFHDRGKPTAVICHGPYALLSTKHAPGSTGFAYTDYNITSWSNTEEKLVEYIKGGEIPKVETALDQAGANMIEDAGTKFGKITVDRELVSGANPMAANVLGDKFIEMIKLHSGLERSVA